MKLIELPAGSSNEEVMENLPGAAPPGIHESCGLWAVANKKSGGKSMLDLNPQRFPLCTSAKCAFQKLSLLTNHLGAQKSMPIFLLVTSTVLYNLVSHSDATLSF